MGADALRGRPALLTSNEIEALTPSERAIREASWAALADKLSFLVIDRDTQWNGAYNRLGEQFNSLLGVSADTNRCSAEAQR